MDNNDLNKKEGSMKLDMYVNYKGNCREAFRFYEKTLGGIITSMETFRQLPDEANIPEKRKDDIMHARIEIGGGEIFMKMEETPFAVRFTMLRDKFGASWMLLHER
ncbi:hypothetical protein D3C86_1582050 [compost metagenome]